MDYTQLRRWLDGFSGPGVKYYENKVITDTHLPIYGIPMGTMRRQAKLLAKEDWACIWQQARWESYEEVLLLGLTLAYAKEPFSEKLPYIRQLLPHLDSWAHTDSIVPTLKIKAGERQLAWDFAMECLGSDREYSIRFGIIMLLDYFIDDAWVFDTLAALSQIRDERYYVRMAVSWCLAEIAVMHPTLVEGLLQSNALDLFTHNKTIQKMRESYRISPEQKAAVQLLKRKD